MTRLAHFDQILIASTQLFLLVWILRLLPSDSFSKQKFALYCWLIGTAVFMSIDIILFVGRFCDYEVDQKIRNWGR